MQNKPSWNAGSEMPIPTNSELSCWAMIAPLSYYLHDALRKRNKPLDLERYASLFTLMIGTQSANLIVTGW